jgi:hypothetical protein
VPEWNADQLAVRAGIVGELPEPPALDPGGASPAAPRDDGPGLQD